MAPLFRVLGAKPLALALVQITPAKLTSKRGEEGLSGKAYQSQRDRSSGDLEAIAGNEHRALLSVDGEDQLFGR